MAVIQSLYHIVVLFQQTIRHHDSCTMLIHRRHTKDARETKCLHHCTKRQIYKLYLMLVFKAVNGLLSKCTSTMNGAVLLNLCNTMCKPILLYASECVYNSRSDVLHVTKAWNQLFYKLFRVSEQDCINDIQMLSLIHI